MEILIIFFLGIQFLFLLLCIISIGKLSERLLEMSEKCLDLENKLRDLEE